MSHKHTFSTRASHERLEKLSKVKLLPQILLTYNWLKLDDARLLMYYCMIVAFKSIIQILTRCFWFGFTLRHAFLLSFEKPCPFDKTSSIHVQLRPKLIKKSFSLSCTKMSQDLWNTMTVILSSSINAMNASLFFFLCVI